MMAYKQFCGVNIRDIPADPIVFFKVLTSLVNTFKSLRLIFPAACYVVLFKGGRSRREKNRVIPRPLAAGIAIFRLAVLLTAFS